MKISLTLALDSGAKEEAVSEDIPPAEIETLRSYCGAIARVREMRLLKRGMPAIRQINWGEKEGFKLECPPVENSELFELLHVLRPIVLSQEPASFERAAAIIGRRFASQTLRNWLKDVRRVYEHGELNLYMQMQLNDQKLFHDSLLRLWLNAEQYHQDKDKAAEWADLEAALTKENARAIVINQLQSRVRGAFDLEHVASLIVNRADKIAT